MSNLSTADRQKEPLSSFCGPNRTFPIKDASDVMDAARLVGKADDPASVKACIMGKAKANGWPIPEAWKTSNHAEPQEGDMDIVSFAAELPANKRIENGMVVRSGKIFEVGSHTPGNSPLPFEVTPEELQVAAWTFKPVDVSFGHPTSAIPKQLQGQFGQLRKIEYKEDGTLVGETVFPPWLDTMLGDEPVKVSPEWNRATKQLTGLTLAESPMINGASLSAAFASSYATQGVGTVLQSVHDMMARAGAKSSDKTEGNATFASGTEKQLIQTIHDTAASHSMVSCDPAMHQNQLPSFPGYIGPGASFFARSGLMSLTEKIKDLLGRNATEEQIKGELTPLISGVQEKVTQNPTPSPTPTFALPQVDDARLKAVEAELDKARKAAVHQNAVSFAKRMVSERRAMPAEEEAMTKAYEDAGLIDMERTLNFAEGTQPMLLTASIEAAYMARPQHTLLDEKLASFAQPTVGMGREAEVSEDRLNELLNVTPLGKQVQKTRKGN